MQKYFLTVLFFMFLISCSKPKKVTVTDNFKKGERLIEVTNEKIAEASGLVESIKNPGYFWTHNDSGNPAEIFLIDKTASIKLTCKLKGIKNRDWEDVAIGPGPDPGKIYLYVADIGDNFERHSLKFIYRFEEPIFEEGVHNSVISSIDKITFKLDEKKDSETLLLDPKTKDLYVVSKREEPVYVYRLKYPYHNGKVQTAQQVCSLPITQITSGSFSADGKEILLKNYEEVYYWKINDNDSIVQALKRKPQAITYSQEAQGEAITWARDGTGYYTLSEQLSGYKSFLIFYKRN